MTAQPPPPAYPPPQPAGQAPKNYLVWSILVTLFCCLPLGIVAIVKSASVNGLWAQGQYAEAQAAAASAKKWVTWAVVVGLIVNVIYVGYYVANMNADTNSAAAVLISAF